MEPKTSVAIEIASSKIKGAVATEGPGEALRILALEEIPVSGSVRHGRVQNIREVSAAVNEVIRRLEQSPALGGRKIQSVLLGFGGRSLCGIPATAHLSFNREIEVTDETVRRLKKEAAKDFVSAKNIEDTIQRTFYVNNLQVNPVVGTIGSTLRGEFLLLTAGKETRQNLERLKFDTITAGNVYYQLRPTALGDALLSPDDRQVGCALVDFGAETTTVAIYKDGAMAFLATLPMGSRLITLDLMGGLRLTEAAAEDFKLRLGNLGDPSDEPNAEEVNNYVRARAGEIAANIVHQIELSGFGPEDLGAGIVLTGGGSRLPHFGQVLAGQSHMDVREAEIPDAVSFFDGKPHSADADIVALLLAASALDDFNGLAPAPRPAEEVSPQEIYGEPDNDVAEDEASAEAERPRRSEPLRRTTAPSRYDDEDDLLKDDPDEEEDDDSYVAKRTAKPNSPAPRKQSVKTQHPRPVADDEEDDDPEDTYEGDDLRPRKKNGLSGLSKLMNEMSNTFAKIFTTPTDQDEEDDE